FLGRPSYDTKNSRETRQTPLPDVFRLFSNKDETTNPTLTLCVHKSNLKRTGFTTGTVPSGGSFCNIQRGIVNSLVKSCPPRAQHPELAPSSPRSPRRWVRSVQRSPPTPIRWLWVAAG